MVKEKFTYAEKRISDGYELVKPDLKKIDCRDCELRAKDVKFGGKTVKGAELAVCEAFPEGKPNEVLWENESCPYYIGERDE